MQTHCEFWVVSEGEEANFLLDLGTILENSGEETEAWNKEGSENRGLLPLTFAGNMESEGVGGALLCHSFLSQWKIPYFESPSATLLCLLWPINDLKKKKKRVREKQLCCREKETKQSKTTKPKQKEKLRF